VVIAAMILLVFIAFGQILLEALGIDLASFRIAGGLVLLVIALRMILEDVRATVPSIAVARGDVAVFPLAMPFIAGPASIMAVVLLSDNNVYTVWQQIETGALTLVVLALTYCGLVAADFVQRVLGPTGANVVSRIMGLILSALAIQSLLTGMREVLHW
jgi:multiple antibiotic resistance protein